MSKTTIDLHVEAWVDRDIAEGVLASEKRAERIGWRREKYCIGINRHVTQGWLGSDGTIGGWPQVFAQVYLQYGSTPVDRDAFQGSTISYACEVREGEPLDDDDVDFVRESVAALRRDLAPDLKVDIKGNVLRLNRDLSVA